MKKRTIFSIFASLVLVFSLFVPGVMAHEREVSDSQAMDILTSKEIPKITNGESLSDKDQNEIESLINLFLKDVTIENLDLSQMKTLSSEDRFEIGGTVDFDVVNGNLRQTYTAEMYTRFSIADSSVYAVSVSGGDFYETEIYLNDDASAWVVSQISVSDNNYQKNLCSIPCTKTDSDEMIRPKDSVFHEVCDGLLRLIKYDLPSNPPNSSYLLYNDVQLSQLLNAAGIVFAIAGLLSGLATADGIVGLAAELYNYFGGSISGVQPYNTYVDIFWCPPSIIPYNSYPAWGIRGYNMPLYLEVDYYYK